jgi:hypothetical protein
MTPPRHQSNQRDVIYSAPFSDEVEAGLINLALNSAECFYKLEEAGITDKFFFGEAAAYLFGLLKKLTEEGQGSHPTQFSLLQRIKAMGDGGEAYYGYYRQIQAEPITVEWFARYLKQLVNLYKKRQFLTMAGELAQMAVDDDIPAEACTTFSLDRAERIDRATNPLISWTVLKWYRS